MTQYVLSLLFTSEQRPTVSGARLINALSGQPVWSTQNLPVRLLTEPINAGPEEAAAHQQAPAAATLKDLFPFVSDVVFAGPTVALGTRSGVTLFALYDGALVYDHAGPTQGNAFFCDEISGSVTGPNGISGPISGRRGKFLVGGANWLVHFNGLSLDVLELINGSWAAVASTPFTAQHVQRGASPAVTTLVIGAGAYSVRATATTYM
eukprot:TRINITY_DN5288_c0_g2_i1.p1 TRINITY_DN5288_c0_g2~~TRINITY_DN5288_c0_g2_i1.p1  ORF type:complete len:215 (+),score=18.89 TRINITY_DN5288_c0_g2_i1:23-646(+)